MKFALLGMHRSGTSALAGLMTSMGFWAGTPGDLLPPSVTNPKGFWERRRVIEINDKLLRAQEASWFNPLPFQPLPELMAEAEGAASAIASEIAALEGTGQPAILKDPRLCLTMPAWAAASSWDGFIVALRDPREVAVSLNSRYGFSLEHGFALWEHYNRAIARFVEHQPMLVVNYEDLLTAPFSVAERLLAWSVQRGVKPEHLRVPPDEVLGSVVSDSLRRSRVQPEVEAIYADHPVRALWEAMQAASGVTAAAAPLSDVSKRSLAAAAQVVSASDRGHDQVSDLVRAARADAGQDNNAISRVLARSMDLVDRRLLDISNRLDRNAAELAAQENTLQQATRRLDVLEQQGSNRDLQSEAEIRAVALRLDYQEDALGELNSTLDRLSQQLAASLEQQELQQTLGEELRLARQRLDAAESRSRRLEQGAEDLVQYVEAFKRSLRYRWTRYARDALDDFSVRAHQLSDTLASPKDDAAAQGSEDPPITVTPDDAPVMGHVSLVRQSVRHLEAIRGGTLVPAPGDETPLFLLHGTFHRIGDPHTLAVLRNHCSTCLSPVSFPTAIRVPGVIRHIGGNGALARFQIATENTA